MELVRLTRTLEKVRKNSLEEKEPFFRKTIESPVGFLTLEASDTALLSILWGKVSLKGTIARGSPILTETEKQLREYFKGKRTVFDIPLDPRGTEFQKLVWRELSKIPYGERITYGEQARRLGRPKSARAVGAANGRNPISIIVPCHRVVGSTGDLTGFAGGLKTKRKLLDLEASLI